MLLKDMDKVNSGRAKVTEEKGGGCHHIGKQRKWQKSKCRETEGGGGA